MLGKVFDLLIGLERLKHRGDRFFLAGDFARAREQYRRARSVVSAGDHRAATLDALIRECATRVGDVEGARFREIPDRAAGEDAASPFLPGIDDFFELAIGEKEPARAASYRSLGPEFRQGYVALVQGEAERAVERLTEAARRRAPEHVLQLELGRALSLAGDMRGARGELQKALALAPEDEESAILLAAVHLQLAEPERAERLLRRLAEREDASAEIQFLMGRALAEQGKSADALEHYRKAVRRDASFSDAYFEGGRILEARGDIRGALELLRRAASLVPDDVEYNRRLARLVLDHELEVETGLAACDRLMVTDEENRWQYLSWIAELYVRRGWKSEARDPLRKAIALVPAERGAERLRLEQRLAALEA